MTAYKLSDHIGNKQKAIFVRFVAGVLWYRTDATDFEFPVPADELDGASVSAREPASMFLRWIRRHIAMIEREKAAQSAPKCLGCGCPIPAGVAGYCTDDCAESYEE
jgi:hypothetical protein